MLAELSRSGLIDYPADLQVGERGRVAVFDTLTRRLYVAGAGTAPMHYLVVQNQGLPIDAAGRYVGGFLRVDRGGHVSFVVMSGTYPIADPALPANAIDRIRGVQITVVE